MYKVSFAERPNTIAVDLLAMAPWAAQQHLEWNIAL
jgi:hypothetical protein